MSATTLYTALLAAQQAMGPVKKDANNPAFRTKYATLQSVLETVEGPLWANGIFLVQRFASDQGGPLLITELIHAESGQNISSTLPIVSKDPTDPQKMGGAITYARRYSLLALLGLSPEDDDGNSAAQPRQQAPQRQSPAPRQTTQQRPVQAAQQAPQPDDGILTEPQRMAIADAWDMAEARDSYNAVAAQIRTMEATASPEQWTEIKRRFVAIRRKHFPESLKQEAEGATR